MRYRIGPKTLTTSRPDVAERLARRLGLPCEPCTDAEPGDRERKARRVTIARPVNPRVAARRRELARRLDDPEFLRRAVAHLVERGLLDGMED